MARISILTAVHPRPVPRRRRAPARPKPALVQPPSERPHYALRRPDGTDLCISRFLLSCLYGVLQLRCAVLAVFPVPTAFDLSTLADLSVHQLCAVLRISLTTAKKIRGWAGLRCWPRVDVLAGRVPGFSLFTIYHTRLHMMVWARENNAPEVSDVLVRAQAMLYPDAFTPIPAWILDQLDDDYGLEEALEASLGLFDFDLELGLVDAPEGGAPPVCVNK